MEDELQKIKEIFLAADIDSEDYQDNLARITEWEKTLRQSEDFSNWQESDVTQSIARVAKEAYKDVSMPLLNSRSLTDPQKYTIWAKQDAIVFLLSLIEKDVKSSISQIQNEIRQALKAV